jgi:heme-degrading monooxygenase HmoA/ketosteroid isomerase-like protein
MNAEVEPTGAAPANQLDRRRIGASAAFERVRDAALLAAGAREHANVLRKCAVCRAWCDVAKEIATDRTPTLDAALLRLGAIHSQHGHRVVEAHYAERKLVERAIVEIIEHDYSSATIGQTLHSKPIMDRRVIVFRSRLRDGIAEDYNRHADAVHARAITMKGFVDSKDFVAEDGERLALIEWDSAANLADWRDEPSHRAAQQMGRDRYYTEYRIQICSELRSSKFDGTNWTKTDRDPATLRAIAERWLACFDKRDLDGLLALYADDATHTSPKIRARHPDTGGQLRGKAAMRAWWQDSFDRLPSMRYVPIALTADAERVFMEYVRRVDGEPDMPVAEVLEVRDGLIVASRVFHG